MKAPFWKNHQQEIAESILSYIDLKLRIAKEKTLVEKTLFK